MNLKITELRTKGEQGEAEAVVLTKGEGEHTRALYLDADDALQLLDFLLLHASSLDRARQKKAD